MTHTLHPGGLEAKSEPGDEWVYLSVPDHKGGEVTIGIEKIVLRSLAATHLGFPDARPYFEVRDRRDRLLARAEQMKAARRSSDQADLESDASMLTWVLGEDDED